MSMNPRSILLSQENAATAGSAPFAAAGLSIVVTPDYPARVAHPRHRESVEIRTRAGSQRAHLNSLNPGNSCISLNPAGNPSVRSSQATRTATAGACCVIARLRHHYEEKAAHCLPEMEG